MNKRYPNSAASSLSPREPLTTAILYGRNRTLLNWLAYAFAANSRMQPVWQEVRAERDASDAERRGPFDLIPRDRRRVLYTDDPGLKETVSERALTMLIRPERAPHSAEDSTGVLLLPVHSQDLLFGLTATADRLTLVVSDTDRTAGLLKLGTAENVVRTFARHGIGLIVTYAGPPPEERHFFDIIVHLEGDDPNDWKNALLRVEKGVPAGPLRSGSSHRIRDLPPVSAVLERVMN